MFGYSGDAEKKPTVSDLQMLLAHEMAHNWPRLTDNEHPLTAWYTEGTAEYYSLILSQRADLLSLDRVLPILNQRVAGYYENPHVALSNAAAGDLFWSDARAQRIPYGRGFMYLSKVNAEIRKKTNGARSLDDLVLAMLARQRRDEKAGLKEWTDLVVAELGEGARKEFDDMVSGKLIVLPDDAFGKCFRQVAEKRRPYDLGFDEMRLGVVANLRADSAAAAAGLKEGDAILSMTPSGQLRDDASKPMTVSVKRGDQALSFSFLPRGAEVQSYRWERVPGIADADCRM